MVLRNTCPGISPGFFPGFVMSFALCLFSSLSSKAFAQIAETREALSRVEELIQIKLEDGSLDGKALTPLLVVSAEPHYQLSKAGYGSTVLALLSRIFYTNLVRVCVACNRPSVDARAARLETRSGLLSLDEVRAEDARIRGEAAPAKAAIWVDETPEGGVSLRIVSLADGRVLAADLVTSDLAWSEKSRKNFSIARDLQRRGRGESLTHAFLDLGLFPSQHIAIDWMEQWGESNRNLSGLSLSIFTPVFGLGPTYARVFPNLFNTLIGGKALLSIPTALVRNITNGSSGDLIDPLLSGIAYARVPIPLLSGNYSGFLFAQIPQGSIGIGLSANNMSLLPLLP